MLDSLTQSGVNWMENEQGVVGRSKNNVPKVMIRSFFKMLLLNFLLILTFVAGVEGSSLKKGLPDAGEVILRQLIEDHKELLSRFGYLSYDENEWKILGEAELPSQVVVLVHGLDEMGTIWSDMAPALEKAGHHVLKFSYPNDQGISRSAILLREQLKWLKNKGADEVVLVAHSMGGLVCRDAITRDDAYEGSMPKIKRLITLGTPNHGAPLALFRHVAEWREHILRMSRGEGSSLGPILDGLGEAAEDLAPGSNYLKELNSRAIPKAPMTIIAGRIDQDEVNAEQQAKEWDIPWVTKTWQKAKLQWKALTKKVGDGVVPLESTPIDGVKDYRIVRGNHRAIIKNFFEEDNLPPGVKIVIEVLEASKK